MTKMITLDRFFENEPGADDWMDDMLEIADTDMDEQFPLIDLLRVENTAIAIRALRYVPGGVELAKRFSVECVKEIKGLVHNETETDENNLYNITKAKRSIRIAEDYLDGIVPWEDIETEELEPHEYTENDQDQFGEIDKDDNSYYAGYTHTIEYDKNNHKSNYSNFAMDSVVSSIICCKEDNSSDSYLYYGCVETYRFAKLTMYHSYKFTGDIRFKEDPKLDHLYANMIEKACKILLD